MASNDTVQENMAMRPRSRYPLENERMYAYQGQLIESYENNQPDGHGSTTSHLVDPSSVRPPINQRKLPQEMQQQPVATRKYASTSIHHQIPEANDGNDPIEEMEAKVQQMAQELTIAKERAFRAQRRRELTATMEQMQGELNHYDKLEATTVKDHYSLPSYGFPNLSSIELERRGISLSTDAKEFKPKLPASEQKNDEWCSSLDSHSSVINTNMKPRYREREADIRPEDSASNISGCESDMSSSSVKRAKIRELQLEAKVEAFRNANEIKRRKQELAHRLQEAVRQHEEENQRLESAEEEAQITAEYEAAKAVSRILQEEPSTVNTVGPKSRMTTTSSEAKPTAKYKEATMAEEAKTNKDPLVAILDKLVTYQRESTLPTPEVDSFDGSNVLQFPLFLKTFTSVVEDVTKDNKRRLEMLLKYTKGEAKQLIKDCVFIDDTAEAYRTAIKLLKINYGQSAMLAAKYKEKAEQWTPIKSGDSVALKKYAVFLTGFKNARKGTPELQTIDSYEFLKVLVCKLPKALQQQWIKIVGRCREEEDRAPRFEDLEKYVSRLSRDENDPRIAGLGYQGHTLNKMETKRTGVSRGQRGQAYATSVQQDKKPSTSKQCTYCGPESKHAILECRKFTGLQPEEKSQVCRTKGLCYGCLKTGHTKRQCKNPEKCTTCSRRHPTVLHDPARESSSQHDNKTTIPGATGYVVSTRNTGPLMTIVPVLVKTTTGSRCISTYAFLDNGCGAVFAAKELCHELNTRTRYTKLFLKTLNSEETMETSVAKDQLQISDISGSNFLDLPSVYLKDVMPVTNHDIPRQADVNKWSHLEDISLPDISMDNDCIPRVTLLIGSNVPAASQPIETRTGDKGEPYAIRSPLGWMIFGLSGSDTTTTAAHLCQISSVTSVQTANDRLEEQMKTYINMEFPECLSESAIMPSKEDQKFMKLMKEEVKLKDGHFEAPLPFRNENVNMPNNRTQAYTYANHLKKRLSKNEDLLQHYREFMNNQEAKGHSEKVPQEELQRNDGKVWFIPHHAVKHPQKGKVRVVFNCPASYDGASLNNALLQGPDLTNRLLGILLRWRKKDVAIMADIEAMYYQVNVPQHQRDMLRYLWWPNGDLSQNVQEYRMKVHVFGAVSSPSVANYCLKKSAVDDQCDKKVADAIQTEFYVDDFVTSVDTAEEAVELAHGVQQVLAKAGFNLTKFVTNDRKVLDTIPTEHRAKGVKNLNLNDDNLPTERTLGVLWDVEKDELGFTSKDVDHKATRRNILSVTSSIYDPIGPTAPYVLKAKMILQALCKEKIGWDEPVPEEQERQWKTWLENLPKLERLRINRAYQPKNFGMIIDRQVHFFADASQDGYGTVSYLRQVNENHEIHVEFLTAKARVAPLKRHTIPKMELTAATSAVKQHNMVKRELNAEIHRTVFWTDSTTVLKYIMNESARQPVFVANRLAVIHDGSRVTDWRYVPTSLNPADHASRGMKAEELTSKPEWLKGPEFLWKPEEEWPENYSDQPEINGGESDLDSKLTAGVAISIEKPDHISRLLKHYSDWTRLRRAVAWWLRLKDILRKRMKNQHSACDNKTLSAEELDNAEKVIICYVQHQSFPKEINILKRRENEEGDPLPDSKECVSATSNIANLDPKFVNGVLRVGGRLRNANIPLNAKHQMIIPKTHHVADLIIRHAHQESNHLGKNHTLSQLRRKYWIVQAGIAIKRLLRKCVVCRRLHGKVSRQKMADLPASRVKACEPPFTYTGVDYFGPFEIKQGRSIKKRYGVIFTCMNSRAVHLEIAECMDTSSCVNALRRFVCRRGQVREITSDNGTNLCGAERELRQAIQELDQEVLHTWAAKKGITWKFNPPAASHHGGVWERLIRSVRQILQSTLREQHVKVARSEEQLQTLMCEVENTLNSRPLTKVSEDPRDLDVITPNDLLQPRNQEPGPPGKFIEEDKYSRQRWRQVQFLADLFWKRWTREYLPTLQRRQKWLHPERNYEVGDVVLVADSHAPRNSWPMGRIERVHKGSQGHVRSAEIKTKSTSLTRPITKLCLLLEHDM